MSEPKRWTCRHGLCVDEVVAAEDYDRLREERDALRNGGPVGSLHADKARVRQLARELAMTKRDRDDAARTAVEARASAAQLAEAGEAMAAWIRDNTCSSDCGDNCQAGAAALEAWLAVFDAKEKT